MPPTLRASDAVLLTCHGTVETLDDLPAFLANVRRGRPAPADLLAEVRRRYELVGRSPLMDTSRQQAAALEARLGIPVRVAGRLWSPLPGEILAELSSLGATRVLSLPLAPQSVHVYHAAVSEAARARPELEIVEAAPWGTEPALIGALCETVDEALADVERLAPARPANELPIVLTAHSLPERVLRAGDPYEAQFRAMASQVAARFEGRGHPVSVAFQSQGATEEPWLGPDLDATFASLSGAGHSAVIVAPIGFQAEHVETLYDLDIEARALAAARGHSVFARAPAVGARAGFVDALLAVARRHLHG
jgi:ferrochelatase